MTFRLLLAFAFCLYLGCDVDRDFVTGDGVQLRFEADTLSFDTVFTARGSATLALKVYNDASDPVRIDRVAVAGMTGVNFTFNVDGSVGPEVTDVVIWGKDSIFVFVEAEVDPTNPEEVSPFIAEDRLRFETGNVSHEVVLQAFGQNANYISGFNRGQFFQLICQDGAYTFPVDLPTVIYGSLFVDSCTVRALAGTRIYFHGGIQRNDNLPGSGIFNDGFIFTQPNGRLELLGTLEKPVIIASDRLEEGFRDSRGAYRGLIFGPESRGNRLEYVEIRNAIVGITADSLTEVSLDNVIVENTSASAITAYQSVVTARNSLFHSNFDNTVQFIKGGTLELDHCTLANYSGGAAALALTNFVCFGDDDECLAAPMTATVRNSILAGSRGSSISFGDITSGRQAEAFRVSIQNSVTRVDNDFLTQDTSLYADFYGTICQDCYQLESGDPLFVDIGDDDYRLDSLSVARGLGVFLSALPADLDGNVRNTEKPDAGALEWQPEG